MITLGYTTEDMISSLQRIGYEVKFEKENTYVTYFNHEQPIEKAVYNCYYKGNRMDMFDWKFGTGRLEMVFEQEIRKRILSLFKD
jgi:hypothetical protein